MIASKSKANMFLGPYGPIWAHMGTYGPIWALMGPPGQVRTCPISDFWSNCVRLESKTWFLTKFVNDFAWFLFEKLKIHVIFIKNINI